MYTFEKNQITPRRDPSYGIESARIIMSKVIRRAITTIQKIKNNESESEHLYNCKPS